MIYVCQEIFSNQVMYKKIISFTIILVIKNIVKQMCGETRQRNKNRLLAQVVGYVSVGMYDPWFKS